MGEEERKNLEILRATIHAYVYRWTLHIRYKR